MSAEVTIAMAQGCVRSALADEVAAIGGIAVASQECGVSEDTIRRWLAGTAGDWTGQAIGAMVAAAHRRTGRSLLRQRLGFLLDGAPVIAGDGRRACADAAATLPLVLAEAQRMAAALADGRITRDEARSMLADLPALARRLESLQTDLAALLRSGAAS